MVRSIGIAAVVVGLAWTGLVEAQSSTPTATARPRFITVSEQGQQPQRCKLLKTWNEANGARAFQVQAVDTGELMTIVSSGSQASGSDAREMPTRIYRWGHDNKPPAGTPLPPPTATVLTPLPAPPAAVRPTSVAGANPALGVKPLPIRPAPLTAMPRSTPVSQTVQKTDFTSAPAPSRPAAAPYALTNNKPALPDLGATTSSGASAKSSSLTPLGTQGMQCSSCPTPGNRCATVPCTTSCQSRLVPTAAGTVGSQKSCTCDCSQSCNSCCTPCNPCSQSTCVSNTPSPMRQPFIGRLFKSNAACTETAVACKPAPSPALKPAAATLPASALAKATTGPAKPGDWRESWGKIEPWKTSVPTKSSKPAVVLTQSVSPAPTPPEPPKQAEPLKNSDHYRDLVLTKRANPTPVTMEPAKQPDPLKNPGQYRDIVMNARLSNSKIPQAPQPFAGDAPLKNILQTKVGAMQPQQPVASGGAAHPADAPMAANVPPGMMSVVAANGSMPALPPPAMPNRVVQIAADEPNAFWAPQKPSGEGKEQAKNNAFDREEEQPAQQGNPQAAASVPRGPLPMPGVLPTPPRGPMLMNPPHPPSAPYTSPSGLPRPMSPDTGVAGGMGNAFTLSGTSRPIPADFGGTPQEPNGFDPLVQMGQGSPPIAYGMLNPGVNRPPMPNMVAMGPRAPMGVNPLMTVPPTPGGWQSAAAAGASARPANVPQALVTLRESLYPSERETAAEQLSELNWRSQPLVVETLMKVAREDPAATVRAACIHALAQMKADSTAVVTLVRDLKSDRDPRVRQEAEEALSALGESDIRQTSHK